MERRGRLNLGWLETFLAVARQRSFTAAATTLRLTQPAVSRQVQRLEQELGTALFERGGGTVRLTAAGERFRAYAEAALEQHRGMLRELGGDLVLVAGELRIAASTTPNEFLVPELLASFVGRYPRVRPYVHVADSRSVAEEVRAGCWDVGFVGARVAGLGLRYRPVAEDEVVLAVPFAHPFAERGEVALDELAGQPFLEREGGSGTAARVRQALAEQGLRLPKHPTVMVLDSPQAIVSAVEQGLGVGWVSSRAVASCGRQRAAVVRLAGVPMRRELSLVVDPRRPLPPPAAAFVDWIREGSNNRDATTSF